MEGDLLRLYGPGKLRVEKEKEMGWRVAILTDSGGTEHRIHFLDKEDDISRVCKDKIPIIQGKIQAGKGPGKKERKIVVFREVDLESLPPLGTLGTSKKTHTMAINFLKTLMEGKLEIWESAQKKEAQAAQEAALALFIGKKAPANKADIEAESSAARAAIADRSAAAGVPVQYKGTSKECIDFRDQKRAEALHIDQKELGIIRALWKRVEHGGVEKYKAFAGITKEEKKKMTPVELERRKGETRILWTEKGPKGEIIQRSVRLKMLRGELYAEVRGRMFGKGGSKSVEDKRSLAYRGGEDVEVAYAKLSKGLRENESTARATIDREKKIFALIDRDHIPFGAVTKWRCEKSYAYAATPYTYWEKEWGENPLGGCSGLTKIPPSEAYEGTELADRLQIVRGVAHFLRGLHQAGYIHGDIKPGNVMIARRDEKGELQPAVTDFDTAVRFREVDGEEVEGKAPGTPFYEPRPPIWASERGTLVAHPGYDTYALGIMLAEMKFGHREPKKRFDDIFDTVYKPLLDPEHNDVDRVITLLCCKDPKKVPTDDEVVAACDELCRKYPSIPRSMRESSSAASSSSSSTPVSGEARVEEGAAGEELPPPPPEDEELPPPPFEDEEPLPPPPEDEEFPPPPPEDEELPLAPKEDK